MAAARVVQGSDLSDIVLAATLLKAIYEDYIMLAKSEFCQKFDDVGVEMLKILRELVFVAAKKKRNDFQGAGVLVERRATDGLDRSWSTTCTT